MRYDSRRIAKMKKKCNFVVHNKTDGYETF